MVYLVGAMASLGVLLEAGRSHGRGGQLIVGAVVSAVGAYVGARVLFGGALRPADRHRARWLIGMTLLVGSPAGASGIPYARQAGVAGALLAIALGAVFVAALVGFAVLVPHRGPLGWWLARGRLRCRACGRASPPEYERCMYCDAPMPRARRRAVR